MTKFIAIYTDLCGVGDSPEGAVKELSDSYEERECGWDNACLAETMIYQVGKAGKPSLTVAWERDQ